MKFTDSINKQWIYRRMYKSAKNVVCKNIVVYIQRNKKGENRLGLTCTKTVGNAVERNRTRRLMREAYRVNEEKLLRGVDCIMVARTRAKFCKMQEIERDFLYACGKMSVLQEDNK